MGQPRVTFPCPRFLGPKTTPRRYSLHTAIRFLACCTRRYSTAAGSRRQVDAAPFGAVAALWPFVDRGPEDGSKVVTNVIWSLSELLALDKPEPRRHTYNSPSKL